MVVGYHRTWQYCLWSFWVLFPENCPSLFCRVASHLNVDSVWMHSDIALLPPRESTSPLARFGRHDGPVMRRSLCSSHLLRSGCHRSRGSKSSAQPGWPRLSQPTGHMADYITCLPQMQWLTSLKWSFCWFAENFGLNMLNSSLISSAFSHIAFLSRLLAGWHPVARPQGSYNLNGCRYRTILRWENERRRWTQLHCFTAWRRLLLRVLNRHSGVNRYPQCRLGWLILGRDHSARPDSTRLNWTIWVELSWVRSGTVLTALEFRL